jgi:secretion/DNA translocation related CpaE-like protein
MTSGSALLVTADDLLAGEVLRLAAAAGAAVDVTPGWGQGLGRWAAADLVLVGADQAATAKMAAPPRRAHVHVVSHGPAPEALFRSALDLGATTVAELPSAERWVVDLLSDLADGVRRPAVTVAVVGGYGGVGATVLAGALALTAARRGPAMLADLDPWGPGMRRLVGLEDGAGVTWRDLAESSGRLGSRALREALPVKDGARVLGWPEEPPAPLPPSLVREVVSAGRRGHDWLVLDVPRTADEATFSVVRHCDHAVLVAGSGLASVAAAARTADRVRAECVSVGVVVRSRRGTPFAPDVARAVALPLWGHVPDQRRLDEHLDLGLGPVHARRSPLAAVARTLVDRWESQRQAPR